MVQRAADKNTQTQEKPNNPWVFSETQESQKTQEKEKEEEYNPPYNPPKGVEDDEDDLLLIAQQNNAVYDRAKECGFATDTATLDRLTDLIAKHTHPMLEQFFFGLDENNCIALIDDVRYPFTGNMLLHIPLGSDHGVLLEETHACHYLWMDFLLNEEALRYMDEAHRLNN